MTAPLLHPRHPATCRACSPRLGGGKSAALDRDDGLRSTNNDHRDVCNHSPAAAEDVVSVSASSLTPSARILQPTPSRAPPQSSHTLPACSHTSSRLDTTGFLNCPLLQAQTLAPYLILFVAVT
ncbi:hypothetical protein DFH08DRAFT_1088552 [Mycena albidolilacea]|uniref:Uncharacterized protein n=1 Tax=Mycena albidolilacea TaxID=1033008 RepID=A0AAD6Z517_9AGAR|nr:hypothetical protein DFH08DRAFT_1088552 [Mycena albidolilacea]